MTLETLVKIATKMMEDNPKVATAEIRLQQYDEIYHDDHGTCACNVICHRQLTEVYLG